MGAHCEYAGCTRLPDMTKEKSDGERKPAIDPYSVLEIGTRHETVVEKANPLEAIALLALPDPRRKTALALLHFESATAATIAIETGRTVEAERRYLMQLCELGYVTPENREDDVYFSV